MAEIIPFTDLMKLVGDNPNLKELTEDQKKFIRFVNTKLMIFAKSKNILSRQKVAIPNLSDEDDVIRLFWEYRMKGYNVRPIMSSIMWGLEFEF